MSYTRITALMLRYIYLLRSSWPRLLEIIFWPTMQLITWGFISQHLISESEWYKKAPALLLTAVLLWDILFRSHINFALSFLEELWSRNLANLFVSPLRPHEMLVSLTVISLLRTMVGVIPACFIALPMFNLDIFGLGAPLILFYLNLVFFGWCTGICVVAILIRFGVAAESLAWLSIFLIAPLMAVYYPVEVLPPALQKLAYSIPPAHVFEGMRTLYLEGILKTGYLWRAAGLNILYFALAFGVFNIAYRSARRHGLLLNTSE
jgi:ABC-2 type transport system permease protein